MPANFYPFPRCLNGGQYPLEVAADPIDEGRAIRGAGPRVCGPICNGHAIGIRRLRSSYDSDRVGDADPGPTTRTIVIAGVTSITRFDLSSEAQQFPVEGSVVIPYGSILEMEAWIAPVSFARESLPCPSPAGPRSLIHRDRVPGSNSRSAMLLQRPGRTVTDESAPSITKRWSPPRVRVATHARDLASSSAIATTGFLSAHEPRSGPPSGT